ncbi:MAG: hypothetical protein BZY88_11675 [SAR202 cluster bacterium Io17-Chloro-G9]|nr:MAG: hypothetical protein BZY88_11675 [SAR202 cluster bacterium Io17-Chloro-G9]
MHVGQSPKQGDVLLLVGTRKGAFILSSDHQRKDWAITGPHHAGSDIFHMAYDGRGSGSDSGGIFAAENHIVWGPQVQISHDLGQSWRSASRQPRFSGEDTATVDRIWHIEPAGGSQPGVLYAGVQPAALFKSQDSGGTWDEITALSKHATRESWQPGLGGLCLHSIIVDRYQAGRMWVGISAVGVFGTNDGGETWQTMNQGVRADFLPDRFPEFGQCPHKVLATPGSRDLLYQQNHCGVYRSRSGGEIWQDITQGLPSRFGFVLGLDPSDPETLFVLPEDQVLGQDVGGSLRYVSDGKFRVCRSRNGGGDWEALTNGLPQENCYLHALREGMDTDDLDPCGIYVGTTTGQIFYSRDRGDHWELLADQLPPINSVDCGLVE